MQTSVLLANGGIKKNWLVFVDGQRTLQDCLLNRLSWHPIKLILDWYHLDKRIRSQTFKSLERCDRRDEIMEKIKRLAWYGLVQQAIDFIAEIKKTDAELIKNEEELDILIGYFDRNRANIPNYEMRKRLGYRNSSNKGEKLNDQALIQRQKHNGMSWSKQGSYDLALLTTLKLNKEDDLWLSEKRLSFKLAA